MSFDYVTTQAALAGLLDELRQAPIIALDTEFERVRTYYPKLCLIQLSTGTRVSCIDTLAQLDLAPLWRLLADTAAPKIMHAGRQDLEIIHLESGRSLGESLMPSPFVDTQVAAGLLGIDEQISYAALVEKELGIALAKAHTRTDWTRRPLDEEQLAYAADDVRYLGAVWDVLHTRLQARGRTGWVEADSEALLDPALYAVDLSDAWKRVKGARRLPPSALARLRRLADWRERRAVAADRPRQWVLRDETLIALAQRPPDSEQQLRQVPGLPPALARRQGTTLLELVRDCGDAETSTSPPPPAIADDRLVKRLLAELRAVAQRESICPTALATRREVEALATGRRRGRLLDGWRHDVVGRALEQIRTDWEAAGDAN